MLHLLEYSLFALGLLYTLQLVLDTLAVIKANFSSNQHLPQQGAWAVITGSTDGIGLGFAEELARKGYNLVQICRNPTKMAAVASNLQSTYGIQTLNLTFQFSSATHDPIAQYSALAAQINHLPISVLVNNVGVAASGFSKNSSEILDMLSVNIWPAAFLSTLLLKNSKLHKRQLKIVNLSSTGAVRGLGLSFLAAYAASKAFLLSFSEVLATEEGNVLGLTPGWVDTPMTRPFKEFRVLLISKNECALKALEQLGSVDTSYGHIKHWLNAWLHRVTNIRSGLLRLV